MGLAMVYWWFISSKTKTKRGSWCEKNLRSNPCDDPWGFPYSFFFLVAGNSRGRGWVYLIDDMNMTAGQFERSTETYLPSISLSLFRCFQRNFAVN